MNIEEIYLDKIWSVVNDEPPEGELMLSGNDQDKVEQILKQYHQDKLKLLGVANVVGRSEQLEAAWKALEWVGFTRGEEFDDEDVNELLGL